MKKIISLILSVTMLVSAAQLFVSADIAPDVVQSQTAQATSTQSISQETTETVQSADIQNNTTANALFKSGNADEVQSGKLATVNSSMLTADSGADLGNDFYARIKYTGYNNVERLVSAENSGNVVVKKATGTADQFWRFIRQSDGYYKIQNNLNSLYLTVEVSSTTPDSDNNVVVAVANESDDSTQKWSISAYEGVTGKYEFIPVVKPGQRLDADNGYSSGADDVSNIHTYTVTTANHTQEFSIEKVLVQPQLSDDFFGMLSFTGMNGSDTIEKNVGVDTGEGKDYNVKMFTPTASNNIDLIQFWHFIKQSDGSYKIKNMNNGHYLYAGEKDTAKGDAYGNVKVAVDDNSDSIRWNIYQSVDNSKYVFIPFSYPGKALDVDKGTTELSDNTNVHLWENNFGGTQKYTITNMMTLADVGKDLYAQISFSGSYISYNPASDDDAVVIYKESTLPGNDGWAVEDNKTKQIWRFVRKGNGSYYITNMNNGKYLTINSKSTGYGVKIEAVSPIDDMSNVCSWFLYSIDGKYVFIPDYTDNRVIDINGGATADGTQVQSWYYNGTDAQKFTLSKIMERAEDLSDDFYANLSYTNDPNTRYLSLNGDNVVVNVKDDSLNQNWRFFLQSDGSYRISNMSNGKCLDVNDASTASETNVWVCDENNSDAQRWFIYKKGDKYVFKAACAPKTVLDVTGGGTTNGTNVQMYTQNGTISQEFTFNTIMTKASLGDDFYANISFVNGTNSENISVSGDSAVVYEKNGSTQQNWHFIKQSDGSYKIVNMYYGYGNCLCAFVSPDSTQTFSEINVNISADDGKYAQRWYIYEINGKYVFKLDCSPNTALEVNNQSTINIDNVLMKTYNGNASQLFEINQGNSLTPANIGDNFNAYINIDKKNVDYSDGNIVIANTIDNQSAKQKWNFVRQTSGNYIGSYEIKNLNDNGKCMDVGSGSSAAGAGVHIYDDNDTGAQRWFIFAQSGKYVLRAACAPNNALTLNSSNNNIYMDTYVGDLSQTFAIEKLIPESDIETVSSDNIKFQLFNYNENINRIGGVKNSDGTDNWRPLAKYFSFLDRSGYINGCPTPKDWFDVSGWYDADGFVGNHATVEPKLKDNYPVIQLDNKKNADGSPATDPQLSQNDRSLGYLFGSEQDNKAVESYYPTNTILQKADNSNGVTHYYYNSTKEMVGMDTAIGTVTDKTANAVDYDFERNKFALRNYTEADKGDIYWSSIFPFNTADTNNPLNESGNREIDNSQVDYWFGMRMDVDFIQNADGKMNASEKMIFNFTGDDDIWVFIDDVLVLDIGGRHTAVKGTIDFATGDINTLAFKNPTPQPQYSTNLYKQFEEAGVKPNGGWKTTSDGKKIFADYTSHKMSFFYLERATGVATCCIDFNLPTPPENSLAVSKQVKDSNGNNVDKDDTAYKFLLKDSDGTVITNASTEGEYQRYENGQLTDKTVDDDGIFTLKNGESVYFKQLDSKKTYIIEEIVNKSYVKSTDVYVDDVQQDGYVVVGENKLAPAVSVTPATDSTKIVKFTNTIKSVDITFKYYGRETVNGKPADIKKEPTAYTKTILANDTNSAKYFDGKTYDNPVGKMIIDVSTNLTPDNLLDTYRLWTSQSDASGANGNTGIKYLATTNDSSNPYYTIVSKNYADANNYQYHADCYGKPVNGEKWITYYNSSGTDVDYESDNSLDVTKVTVWLFNTPKQYEVEAYEAQTYNQLSRIGESDVYVANQSRTKDIYAYYNQRLGLEIDAGAEYSQATNHLANYGINSYVGQKLDTAASIKKDENTKLKFAYWAFDKEGKNIASTDILYNYRIVANTKLYAVYTTDGKVNNGKPGLTVSENERDIFFNSSGTSITRLNTEMNPYNCQNKDANIKNVAIVYVIDQDGSLVTNYTEDMRTKIAEGLSANITKDENGIPINKKDKFTIKIDDNNGNKCNYFAFVVNGSSGITLTNKNRIEFGSDFQTSALSGRRMYAFAAMYYQGNNIDEWIVSDNFIDYNFT